MRIDRAKLNATIRKVRFDRASVEFDLNLPSVLNFGINKIKNIHIISSVYIKSEKTFWDISCIKLIFNDKKN